MRLSCSSRDKSYRTDSLYNEHVETDSRLFQIVSEDNPRLDRLIDAVRGIQNASVSSECKLLLTLSLMALSLMALSLMALSLMALRIINLNLIDLILLCLLVYILSV